jgi:hypothetical protein
MPPTVIRGTQVLDGSIQRADLDIVTAGQAVVAKLVQGSNITLSSTGTDSGTGDVTISATAGINAFTTTAIASFTVPASGSTTTVNVVDASWIIVGEPLYFDTAGGGAGLPGYLIVTAKTGNQLTIKTP